MAKRKRFNVDAFVSSVRDKLKTREIIDPGSLSNSYLNKAAEIIEKYGFEHARVYFEGRFVCEQTYKSDDNKNVLAIRDLVEVVQDYADTCTFASYLIKSIKPILKIHGEEGR